MRPVFFLLLLCPVLLHAQVHLPRLIGDKMILQRHAALNIWGWAGAGESIQVQFAGHVCHANADEDGNWKVVLPAMPAGGPFEMTISGTNTIVLHDILIGDVWLCSGQSNMEQPMGGRLKYCYAEEIATVNNPNIRQFLVPDAYAFKHAMTDMAGGEWQEANPKNIGAFTAVGYFFAKELYARYKVPIGIINAAVGGSPAEAWISEAALKKFPEYYNEMQKWKDDALIQLTEKNDNDAYAAWYGALLQQDAGEINGWKEEAYNDNNWKQGEMPANGTDVFPSIKNGIVWLRKTIDVPASMVGKNAKLELGRIVDADSVFINGVFVGSTTYQYPPRRYELGTGILKPGKNVIVVRIISNNGNGGFVPGKRYELTTAHDTIDLHGAWKMQPGALAAGEAPQATFIRWKPGGLHNAMIEPLVQYAVKGVVWYQGETNANYPNNYKALMQALIEDWRTLWQKKDLPFIYIQLPNFMEAKPTPQQNSNWAILRQQQLETLSVPYTAMVTAIDLGEWNDIHPENKTALAHRVALAAERLAYAEKDIVASGPLFRSMQREGHTLVLQFYGIGGGLVFRNGDAKYFDIAGADGIYYKANVVIENNQVIAWSSKVPQPLYIKYAWADNPEAVNFYNKEGLPASPFFAQLQSK